MALRVLKSYPGLTLQPIRLGRKVRELLRLRETTLAKLTRREVDSELIANFRTENGRYVQDLVTPLDAALASGRDPFWLMDRYLDSIRLGWRSGFAETSFNFTVNHGLTEQGRVVVLDVGEMCFDRAAVLSLLRDRLWEKSFSTRALDPEVRGYLLDRLNRFMTPDRVTREWRDAPITSVKTHAPDRPAIRQRGREKSHASLTKPAACPTKSHARRTRVL